MAQKKTAELVVTDAAPDKVFWLGDGRSLKNLKELAEALKTMEDSVWDFHVTCEKNDFANWVEDVFDQDQLGAAIRRVKSPKTAAKRILEKLGGPGFWSFVL